jgi:hypothetical protein
MHGSEMPRAYASPEIVDGKTVKDLVDARSIRGAVILGRPGGWSIVVRYGAVERSVAAQRSDHPRLWRNLNTAVAFVRDELGISRFEVDTAGYDPDAVQRKRPDQTERLRRQHEAAAHDAWFRGQVEEALDGIEDGTNPTVPEDEARRRLDALRASLTDRMQ